MDKPKWVYLIDFDNTLFDTEALKKTISNTFKEKYGRNNLKKFWEIYDTISKKVGYVDITMISSELSNKLGAGAPEDFLKLFLNLDFKKHVFKHSKRLIKILKGKGRVVLYSTGDSGYQPIKIKKSGIAKLIGKNNVVVLKNKKESLTETLTTINTEGNKKVILIDDRVDFLEMAKKIYPGCVTVWFKYGKYKNLLPKNPFSIDYQTNSPEDIVHFCGNFIATIPQKTLAENVSVLKDISKSQVSELLSITAKDPEIRKFTHDNNRFTSLEEFNLWRKNGKTIYTMVSQKNKLLGIIWFGFKSPLKEVSGFESHCNLTFAIRSYPPARGKGLSRKFINIVFTDFEEIGEKGVWLSTLKNNTRAIKLYKSCGFRQIASTGDGKYFYYLTVTDFAKFLGLSGSKPFLTVKKYART